MNKSYYKKDSPTTVVTIVDDSQDAFFELSNGQMIKKDVFPKYYVEMDNVAPSINESFQPRKSNSGALDPSTFFTSSSIVNQNDIMKLKNADPLKGALENQDRTSIVLNTANKTRDAKPVLNEAARQPSQNESIVQQVDPLTQPIPNNTNTNVSQYKVYDDEDEAYNDFVNKGSTPQAPPTPKPIQQPINEIDQLYDDEKMVYGEEEAERRKSTRLKKINRPVESTQQVSQPQQQIQQQMDPTQMMFKTFKRNHNIKINVEFTDKIGKPDFIKLMMENMDGDIVLFYKQLIIENIRNNFKVIEDEVEKQIRLEIFGDEKNEDVLDNDKINEVKSVIEKITDFSKELEKKAKELEYNDEEYLFDLLSIDTVNTTEKEVEKEFIKGSESFQETINFLNEEKPKKEKIVRKKKTI